jgi:hypothetical protein
MQCATRSLSLEALGSYEKADVSCKGSLAGRGDAMIATLAVAKVGKTWLIHHLCI